MIKSNRNVQFNSSVSNKYVIINSDKNVVDQYQLRYFILTSLNFNREAHKDTSLEDLIAAYMESKPNETIVKIQEICKRNPYKLAELCTKNKSYLQCKDLQR